MPDHSYNQPVKKAARYVTTPPRLDIQVLRADQKSGNGAEAIKRFQEALNPTARTKEKEYHDMAFREGTRLCKSKTIHQLIWEIKSIFGITVQTGTGVFNGDAGIIREINPFAEYMTVEFDDNRLVNYSFQLTN